MGPQQRKQIAQRPRDKYEAEKEGESEEHTASWWLQSLGPCSWASEAPGVSAKGGHDSES